MHQQPPKNTDILVCTKVHMYKWKEHIYICMIFANSKKKKRKEEKYSNKQQPRNAVMSEDLMI